MSSGHLLKRNAGALTWTDMTCAPQALPAKISPSDHVRATSTSVTLTEKPPSRRGRDRASLAGNAGRRWLGRVLSWPGIRSIARVGYDWYADRLYAWNRRHGRW